MYQWLSDFQVGISPGLLPAIVLQTKPNFGIAYILCRTNADGGTSQSPTQESDKC